MRHTFLKPSVDYEPCKLGKKKKKKEIPRFLETFFLKSMKPTRADGEPHAARVTIRSHTRGIFFSPQTELKVIWMFNKSCNVFFCGLMEQNLHRLGHRR